jgi:hypothetical protein
MINPIKTVFHGLFRRPPPISVVVDVPTPVIPPLPVVATSPGIERCWAAWERIVSAEDMTPNATETIKGNGIEKQWAINLNGGKAVMCVLLAYPETGSGQSIPSFDYPFPSELSDGLQAYYANWQGVRIPREETVDVSIYRLDLGPSQVDPRAAFRVRKLGPESAAIRALKKSQRRER